MNVQKNTIVAGTNSDLFCQCQASSALPVVPVKAAFCQHSLCPHPMLRPEKGVKLCLSLRCHPTKPFLAPCHQCRWQVLRFPCQSKQYRGKSPRIPLGPKHLQVLITFLNITGWRKWEPSCQALIHAQPDPRFCSASTHACASSAGKAFSITQRGLD